MRARSAVLTLVATLVCACAASTPTPTTAPGSAAGAGPGGTRAPKPSSYVSAGFIGMPKAPANFDHAIVDDAARLLFLADRTSGAVDVFALQNETFVTMIGGFSGSRGPNGLALVADRGEVWAGDGDSSVKVIDEAKRSVIATVKTGGTGRTDNLAYDAKDKLVLAVNDSDPTPFVTFISVADRRVVGRLEFPGADGLEEVQWSAERDLFYQTVPSTPKNPGGEVDVIDPARMIVSSVLPLTGCTPHAIALGPRAEVLLGCGASHTDIIDGISGKLLVTIPEIGASDDVSFNPTAGHYLVAGNASGTGGTRVSGPAVGIIDAASDHWLQNVATAPGAHIVVPDPTSNHVYVPIPSQGITVLGAGYGVTNVDR